MLTEWRSRSTPSSVADVDRRNSTRARASPEPPQRAVHGYAGKLARGIPLKLSSACVIASCLVGVALIVSAFGGSLNPPPGPIQPTSPSTGAPVNERRARGFGPNLSLQTEAFTIVEAGDTGVVYQVIISNYGRGRIFRSNDLPPYLNFLATEITEATTQDFSLSRVALLSGAESIARLVGPSTNDQFATNPGSTSFDICAAFTDGLEIQLEPGAMATVVYSVDAYPQP